MASKFQPDDLSLLCFLGEEASYQSAVPGLIGIPVKVIPIVLALLVEKLFFTGLDGKQYFND